MTTAMTLSSSANLGYMNSLMAKAKQNTTPTQEVKQVPVVANAQENIEKKDGSKFYKAMTAAAVAGSFVAAGISLSRLKATDIKVNELDKVKELIGQVTNLQQTLQGIENVDSGLISKVTNLINDFQDSINKAKELLDGTKKQLDKYDKQKLTKEWDVLVQDAIPAKAGLYTYDKEKKVFKKPDGALMSGKVLANLPKEKGYVVTEFNDEGRVARKTIFGNDKKKVSERSFGYRNDGNGAFVQSTILLKSDGNETRTIRKSAMIDGKPENSDVEIQKFVKTSTENNKPLFVEVLHMKKNGSEVVVKNAKDNTITEYNLNDKEPKKTAKVTHDKVMYYAKNGDCLVFKR